MSMCESSCDMSGVSIVKSNLNWALSTPFATDMKNVLLTTSGMSSLNVQAASLLSPRGRRNIALNDVASTPMVILIRLVLSLFFSWKSRVATLEIFGDGPGSHWPLFLKWSLIIWWLFCVFVKLTQTTRIESIPTVNRKRVHLYTFHYYAPESQALQQRKLFS